VFPFSAGRFNASRSRQGCTCQGEKPMPTMTLTNKHVVDLVKQLPPEDKRTALFVLAT
jgi:hypothetical protein